MEKTAFEQTARKVQELLEGRVIVDNTKEEVMDFYSRYMQQIERDEEFTGEQVAELNRILLKVISHSACESNWEKEEKRELWRREAEKRSKFK